MTFSFNRPLFKAIASRDRKEVARLLSKAPELATQPAVIGATRQEAKEYFFPEIGHYAYEGDTPLHFAAAAYDVDVARDLIALGAPVHARNRRGAEPIHYAADGDPDSDRWNPEAQFAVIEFLIKAGADPNSIDKSGVAPLHRAVRTRSAAAVRVLLLNGGDAQLKNGSGSTPFHLANHNTGRSGSGSEAAKAQQQEIIRLLQAR